MLAFLAYCALVAFLVILATKMARTRRRSPVAWGWLTFFFGVFAILALWALGRSGDGHVDPIAAKMSGHVVAAPVAYRPAPLVSTCRPAGRGVA